MTNDPARVIQHGTEVQAGLVFKNDKLTSPRYTFRITKDVTLDVFLCSLERVYFEGS